MPHQPASSALQRFRVIDLTQVRAGPTACRQLADWGADVIQVQMPESMRGDDTLGGQEGSDYQYTHRNKRSITLNLKTDEGIATLKRLIDGADVVVENFRPDVKFRLGIDYASLSATNPGLVYASISGFGQTGPLASRPAMDPVLQAFTGIVNENRGDKDGHPQWSPGRRARRLRVGVVRHRDRAQAGYRRCRKPDAGTLAGDRGGRAEEEPDHLRHRTGMAAGQARRLSRGAAGQGIRGGSAGVIRRLRGTQPAAVFGTTASGGQRLSTLPRMPAASMPASASRSSRLAWCW